MHCAQVFQCFNNPFNLYHDKYLPTPAQNAYNNETNLQVKILLAALDEDKDDADEEGDEGPGSHPLGDPGYVVPPLPTHVPAHQILDENLILSTIACASDFVVRKGK